MSADHIQFLINKFIDELQEASLEFDKLPLRLHFQEISEVLKKMKITDSTPIIMKDWLYDLKYALAECVMLVEEEQKRKTQNKKNLLSTHYPKKLWFLRKTGKKLFRIKKKLQSINNFASAESDLVFEQISDYKQHDFPFFDRSKIHGFDEQMQKIEEDLLLLEKVDDSDGDGDGNGIKTIGIVGMAGSGKTVLAQMLFNSQRLKQMYSPMIWVQLSKERSPKYVFTKEEVVKGIMDCFTITNEFAWDNPPTAMLQNMYGYLHETKYLIVLDNVIEPCDWYYDLGSQVEESSSKDYSLLSHGLPRGSGGAIIVTSRNEAVAGKMVGKQNLHQVQPILDSEMCWSIFKDSMSVNIPQHETLLRMKDEIVDKCEGLPLAAKTLAEILPLYIFQERFWADPRIMKAIRLKLNLGDYKSYRKVRDKIVNILGLAIEGPLGDDVIIVYGKCHPIEIVRAFQEFWPLELVSVTCK